MFSNVFISDNGKEFTASKVKNLLLSLKVSQRYSDAYNKQSIGIIERQHRTIKDTLLNLKKTYKEKHMEKTLLKLAQHLYNNTIKKHTEFRQSSLIFGRYYNLFSIDEFDYSKTK